MSHLVDTKPTENAIVLVQETHTVHARDVYGNLQINMDDVFSVTLTNTADSSIAVTGTSTAVSDGTYSLQYTIPTAGTYLLEILV